MLLVGSEREILAMAIDGWLSGAQGASRSGDEGRADVLGGTSRRSEMTLTGHMVASVPCGLVLRGAGLVFVFYADIGVHGRRGVIWSCRN
jgi:hypothetical protein